MPSDTAVESALMKLLSRVESDVHARLRDVAGSVAPIEIALLAYQRAKEEELAHKYALQHSLSRPSIAGVSARAAAENLRLAVLRLPELADLDQGLAGASDQAPSVAGAPEGKQKPADETVGTIEEEKAATRPLSEALPKVVAACDTKKLAVVGVLSGRRRPLPSPLDFAIEWVDTTDGGAHAVGNLPTRIRQGRLFGLIICDQAISHKHSEPLVAAARSVGLPVGFAGKGGGAAIARALQAIEEQL